MFSKKIFLNSSLLATLAVGFIGCGSSDNNTSSTLTGTFVDSAVEGIMYSTATQSGYTNANGEFSYLAGETVTFKIGNFTIGSCSAASTVTPYTKAAHLNSNSSAQTTIATNIARVLQTLDSDGNSSNGLDMSSVAKMDFNISGYDLNVSSLDFTQETLLNNLFSIVGSHMNKTYTIVDYDTARAHLDSTIASLNAVVDQVTDTVTDTTNSGTFNSGSYSYIAIYKNISDAYASNFNNGAAYFQSTPNSTSCTDYGFSTPLQTTTVANITTTNYMNGTNICNEIDYSQTAYSGSTSYIYANSDN